MKTILLSIACVLLIVLNLVQYHLHKQVVSHDTNNTTELIWNDDEESIPAVNGLIKVEMIEGNKFYLTPVQ